MPVAARLQYMRFDSAAIVAHQNTQTARRIFQFDFDVLRPRMAKCVDQRLSADPIHVVTEQRVQGPLLPSTMTRNPISSPVLHVRQPLAALARTPVRDRGRRCRRSASRARRSGPHRSLAASIEAPGSASAWPENPRVDCRSRHGLAWKRSESLAARCRAIPARSASVPPAAPQIGCGAGWSSVASGTGRTPE